VQTTFKTHLTWFIRRV